MKKHLLLAVIGSFLNINAFAMPSLHDYSKFNFTQTEANGVLQTGILEIELTAYDSSSDSFTQITKITVNGKTDVQTDTVKSADLISDAQVAQALQYCAQAGGVLEKIVVLNKSIDTCAMVSEDASTYQKVWIAQLPFGIAKIISKDKSTNTGYDGMLADFHFGN